MSCIRQLLDSIDGINRQINRQSRNQRTARCNPVTTKHESLEINFLKCCFSSIIFFLRQKNRTYIPGDLTEPDQEHHTRNSLLNEPAADSNKQQQLPPLNKLYVEQHKCTDEVELLNKQIETARDKSNGCSDEHILSRIEQLPDCLDAADEKMRSEVTEKPGENNTIPLIPAIYNFQNARKMAQENLEHQPLPDSIMDRAYRKLQAQGVANPELALDVLPIATGALNLNFSHV